MSHPLIGVGVSGWLQSPTIRVTHDLSDLVQGAVSVTDPDARVRAMQDEARWVRSPRMAVEVTTMSTAMFGGTVVSTGCSNCDADADFDVEVMNVETGEVARDVYACTTCADEISVSSDDYYVSMTNL